MKPTPLFPLSLPLYRRAYQHVLRIYSITVSFTSDPIVNCINKYQEREMGEEGLHRTRSDWREGKIVEKGRRRRRKGKEERDTLFSFF